MTRRDLPAITGLRFLAALHVFLFHSVRQWPGWPTRLIDAGPSAVSLFFVLSGFVLAYTYLDGDGAVPARAFWRARFARVYPVYFLGLLIATPIFLVMMAEWSFVVRWFPPATTAANVLLLQAWFPPMACQINCPGWSLSAEAFFYLLFPLVGAAIARRSRPQLVAIASLLWIASLYTGVLWARQAASGYPALPAVMHGYEDKFFMYWPPFRLPEFFLGVAAGRLFVLGPKTGRRWGAASVACLAAIIATCILWPHAWFPLLHNGLLAPVYAALVCALATSRGPLAALLGSRPGVALGAASYAFYILHVPISMGFNDLAVRGVVPSETGDHRVLALLLRLGFTLLMSYLVYRFTERPARALLQSRRGASADPVTLEPAVP